MSQTDTKLPAFATANSHRKTADLMQSSATITMYDQSRDKEFSDESSPRCFRSTRSFQPKRVSELPPLESDSESDDDGNLNCAILNDSFLLTPSKCADDMGSSDKQPLLHSVSARKDSVPKSRIKLEDKLIAAADTDGHSKAAKRQPLVERTQLETTPLSGTSPTKTTRSHDSGIVSHDGIDDTCLSVSEKAPKVERVGPRSPLQTDVVGPEKMQIDKSHHQFVTPREKFPLGVGRGTASRMVTSTAMRNSRSTVENEFKSQKILFATPVVMTRAPVGCLGNDSLNLSLLDTPVKPKEPVHLSPIKEQPKVSKRSTNQLFGGQDGPMKISPPAEPAVAATAVAGANGESIKRPVLDSRDHAQSSTAQPKERPIVINGKEYMVLKKLGSGGSSSVFLAKQVATGLECAIKLVNLNGDATLIEGYLNETKLLAKLQTNENVIALYDYAHVPEASQLFLVMEKGECDLHRILQGYNKDVPLYTLMSIWYQMVQCVHYIHENGVIHLDLKPANFLMIRGRLKLIDFGIASNIAFDSTSIMKFSQAGTFNYISPEALIDTSSEMAPAGSQPRIKMSKKSDIWSLGCILYLLLYKRTPFAHIKNIYTKVNTITNPNTVIDYPPLASYYPPMLLDVVKRCLLYDAKSRASTSELLEYPYDMVIPLNK